MADRVLLISWSSPVRGREERGLEVFNEAIGLYGRMQQGGRIESFDVCILEPNGDLNGYIELRGSTEQLAAVRTSDEFRDLLVGASLIVEGLRVAEGFTGAGLAREMERYQQQVALVPQAH
jgi:hypothetical protein